MNPENPPGDSQLDQNAEAVNIQHFDSKAATYDEEFGLSIELSRERVKLILRSSDRPITKGRALDLGCGTGNLTAALLLEGAAETCTGMDISPAMIEVARKKTAGITGCDFRVGSAASLPFSNGELDLCVGDAFLHHVLDYEACLVEVARVLKPGGVATFNEPNQYGYAMLEFVLTGLRDSCAMHDDSIDKYLHYLGYMREHAGDLVALAAYPLPDKHIFSPERMAAAAERTGFSSASWAPAMYASQTLFRDAYRFILDALQPAPSVRESVLHAGELLDRMLGDEARKHFCVHNQFYLYK